MQTLRNTRSTSRRLAAALIVTGVFCTLIFVTGAAQDLAPLRPSDERPLLDNPAAGWGPNYTNWVEVGIGYAFVDGEKASFQRRVQLPGEEPFGGIEALHYERPVTEDWLFQFDGRAILNNDDYYGKVRLVNPKVGFVHAGYREYRTWYDRHGGYSTFGNRWLEPFDRSVHIDRGEAFIDGGLTIENVPKLTFGYSRVFRDGIKDSTVWGDVNVVGQARRSIVPSFWDIDETRDIFRFDLQHAIGKTDFGIGVRYELSAQRNEKDILRRPGEVVAGQSIQRAVTQNDDMDTDMFNVHGYTETRISDKVLVSTGASYTDLYAQMGGSRIYGETFDAAYNPVLAVRQQRDEGFIDLAGSGTMKQYVANLNLLANPWENVSILPSVRVEKVDESAVSSYTLTDWPNANLAFENEVLEDRNTRGWLDVSEALEARYTGLKNWSFYVKGEWLQGQGFNREDRILFQTITPAGATTENLTELLRDRDSERLTQKYVVGANWYPFRRLSFSGQYYHKIRDIGYDFDAQQIETRLITDQGIITDDFNVRATWRPLMNLTFITRYDFQISTFDMRAPDLPNQKSAGVNAHIISESISWTPFAKLLLNGSVHYAIDTTDTPAEDWPVSPPTPASALVHQSRNNYWNLAGLIGYTLDLKTQLQAQYYYYRADNFMDYSAITQPYDSGAEEHGVTGTLMRQITSAMRWTLKYGFFTSHDRLYGGHTDYSAHLVYSTIQYRF